MNKECVTCYRLGACRTVDAQKLLAHFVCEHYEEVHRPEEVHARCDVINKYGAAGLRALIEPET